MALLQRSLLKFIPDIARSSSACFAFSKVVCCPAVADPYTHQMRHIMTSSLLLAPPPKKSSGVFKAGMTVVKKKMEVETDPYKLVNYLCGGQYLKEGPEIKLGPDSDYPDWLWTLRTTGQVPLEELDPNTMAYWDRVRRMKIIENKKIMKAVRGKKWLLPKPRATKKVGSSEWQPVQ
ncbi:hypothetical protein BV898_09978 [Hypsibius exemplaris]|uniref:Large ribosomal subunit protein mL54 n=1 Tax=Hypsibius exemplaris TaxID=2072580 RepID=A0A1W0WL34_HYPEX|nr:hypothetical protein BV898_09978 [Hypsibius exemplaris]